MSRDGVDSGASVTIYQASDNKVVGESFNSKNSYFLEHTLVPPALLKTPGVDKNGRHMNDSDRRMELLVVVKRGRAANIAEPEKGPYLAYDIRSRTMDMRWPAIKSKYVAGKPDVTDGGFSEDDHQISNTFALGRRVKDDREVDVYRRVDEYTWDI